MSSNLQQHQVSVLFFLAFGLMLNAGPSTTFFSTKRKVFRCQVDDHSGDCSAKLIADATVAGDG